MYMIGKYFDRVHIVIIMVHIPISVAATPNNDSAFDWQICVLILVYVINR